MEQKNFSYSRTAVHFKKHEGEAVDNPPSWAIFWAAQKGMLTEGTYFVQVVVKDGYLDLFVATGEKTNLIIGKESDNYFCVVSDTKPSVIETYDGTKWVVIDSEGIPLKKPLSYDGTKWVVIDSEGIPLKKPLSSGIILSLREKKVNGITEKWHTQIR